MSRVLIVGCGYVGKALAKAYLGMGAEVYALQRHPVDISGVHNIIGNVINVSLQGIMPFDKVFYLVSANDHSDNAYQQAYVAGIRHILQQIPTHSTTRILYISSTAVYGQKYGEWVDENSVTEPNHFSGQRLLEGENLVHESGLDHVVVRFGGIYGPDRTRVIEQIKSGKACLTESPCYTNRIHLEDCVGCLQFLAQLPTCPSIVLGVDCEPVLYNDLQLWLAKQIKVSAPIIGETPARLEKSNKRCSNQLLLDLGYTFTFPNYQMGLKVYTH